MAESRNVDRGEDVSPVTLGASQWQAQAFRSAVFSDVLRFWVMEREAITAIWNSGARRERTAEYADEQLDLADRLTGEGGSRRVPPFPTRFRSPGSASSVGQTGGGVQEGALVIWTQSQNR